MPPELGQTFLQAGEQFAALGHGYAFRSTVSYVEHR